jgi:hypothetical protein
MLNEGNQIHNFITSSGSGTVINYGSGSDFFTSYSSGSTRQKVTVLTVPVRVPVPQHCFSLQILTRERDIILGSRFQMHLIVKSLIGIRIKVKIQEL